MSSTAQERLRRGRLAQASWSMLPFHFRKTHLKRLRHTLHGHVDEIVQTVHEELGKPALDTLAGDVMVTLEQMLYYEKHAEKILHDRRIPGDWIFFRGTRTREVFEPHGIALVIAPWNYPVQLSLIPAITALYAGNAVLCKCSEHVPKTAALLQRIMNDAALPPDLVQISWEPAEEAADLLESHPDFVFFTGSSHNGRAVAARAGELLIPSAMELGGKDAALVFSSCNFERAVNGLVYGAFSNAGQVCVSAKRIYVEASIFHRFAQAFETKARSLRIHHDIGPLRVAPMRSHLVSQLEDARRCGASDADLLEDGQDEVPPQILHQVPADASLLRHESFGPVTCLHPFRDEAEAIALANNSEFGLGVSIWTSDMRQGERLARGLRAGSCVINDVMRNVSHPGAAFGGTGASGYGRYHGAEGLRTFSRIKTVMVTDAGNAGQINWFPFTEKTFRQLRALLYFRHGEGSLRRRAAQMLQTMRGKRI